MRAFLLWQKKYHSLVLSCLSFSCLELFKNIFDKYCNANDPFRVLYIGHRYPVFQYNYLKKKSIIVLI